MNTTIVESCDGYSPFNICHPITGEFLTGSATFLRLCVGLRKHDAEHGTNTLIAFLNNMGNVPWYSCFSIANDGHTTVDMIDATLSHWCEREQVEDGQVCLTYTDDTVEVRGFFDDPRRCLQFDTTMLGAGMKVNFADDLFNTVASVEEERDADPFLGPPVLPIDIIDHSSIEGVGND